MRVRVLGLGALEYALLAPARASSPSNCSPTATLPSLGFTLPWAIAVPLGFVASLWAVEKRETLRAHSGRRRHLAEALDSIQVVKTLFKPRHLLGPLGSAVYWFGDIFCLWACLQAFTHGSPNISLLLLGYATGYALTRRTLPLGGAGAVDALLPFALSWCGISLAAAVLAVFTYRVFNLWLPIVPAALGMRRMRAAAAARQRRPRRLRAAERRRRGTLDAHVDEVSGCCIADEVHRCVAPGPPTQTRTDPCGSALRPAPLRPGRCAPHCAPRRLAARARRAARSGRA